MMRLILVQCLPLMFHKLFFEGHFRGPAFSKILLRGVNVGNQLPEQII
jgi:hypothetical protein